MSFAASVNTGISTFVRGAPSAIAARRERAATLLGRDRIGDEVLHRRELHGDARIRLVHRLLHRRDQLRRVPPQVFVPQLYDQHYWAERGHALGIGTAHAPGRPPLIRWPGRSGARSSRT